MGALTINRKRGNDYYTLNCKLPSLYCSPHVENPIDPHVSKKPRFSSSSYEQPISSKSAVSRVHQYPQPVNRFKREVHAPCRVSKLGFLASSNRKSRPPSKEGFGDVMGNILSFGYDWAKRDEEVIDVDAEIDEGGGGGVSTGSSIEEVEFVEDDCQGGSMVFDQMSQETSGFVPNWPQNSVASDLMKVDNEPMSLKQKLELMGEPLHKRLYQSANRRNPRLNSLRFEIEFNENRHAEQKSLRPAKRPEEEDVLGKTLLPLTKEEEAEVYRALSNSHRRKVLVNHENSNIEITGELLQCLKPGAWLNDEVINVYLELLKEREKREPKNFLKCHFFNTFFYKKLFSGRNGYDFKSVRRWTTQRKLGYCLLDCEKIFVPIHKEIHWCLAVINKKDQKFQYLDSLGGIDSQVLKVLARYFVDEVKEKSGIDIDISSWKQEFVEDLPEQENGWDCGMFMIKYADFYSRGLGLCFNQEDVPYFRMRTAKEILRLKAE